LELGDDPTSFEPIARRSAAQSLVQHLWHDTSVYLDVIPSTFQSEDPTGQWDSLQLDVEGDSQTFSSLGIERHWVALGAVENAILGVQVRNARPTEIRLVAVDAMDYLDDDGSHS
jgi:hypothetical protein